MNHSHKGCNSFKGWEWPKPSQESELFQALKKVAIAGEQALRLRVSDFRYLGWENRSKSGLLQKMVVN